MSNSTSRSIRGRLFTTTLLAGLAAMGAPAAVGLFTALAPATALAQDYTSGSFVGHVTDASGAPVVGATATVKAQATGVSQTSRTDATGTFRAPLIPGGAYTVTITKDGFATVNESDLSVSVGGESNYAFTLAAPNSVAEVVVVAKKPQRQLDFSQTTKGLAIDVEQLQKQVPIARNITAVALLAPGVTTSVPGFTSTDGTVVPSIGGGSAGENAFYLNGLNITNFDNYIGGATVPFDFYKTVEVKTGGYPAEFGRATGGVINATTKSGTNDFYFGVHGDYTPDFARALVPNTYSNNNAQTRSDDYQTSVEVGGPLIKDHLFFYGLYQFNNSITQGASNTAGTYNKDRDGSPFYGYKIDGFLTSRQHVEFTSFNTESTTYQRNFFYTAPANNFTNDIGSYINGGDAKGTIGQEVAPTAFKSGGENWVAKYTGTFTDWFTISGAYGHNNDETETTPGSSALPYVADARKNGTAFAFVPTTIDTTTVSAANSAAERDTTHREFYRIDADLYVNYFGRHHFRLGYDNEDTTLSHFEQLTGAGSIPEDPNGGLVRYSRIRTAGQSAGLGLPLNQEYVRVITENLGFGGANVGGTNQSYYAQDSWDVTRNFNIQLGVRDDVFKVRNLSGETAINLDNNFAPRVALSYDPFGHKTDKITLSYGRYFIPPASNLSFRGHDLYTYQYFLPPAGLSYTPYINPKTGVPTALGAIIGQDNYPDFAFANGNYQACPPGVIRSGSAACIVYGDGSQEPGATKAATNLSATYEDEIILGYTKKIGSLWTFGATVTYRTLGNESEDIDNLNEAIEAFCGRSGNASHAGCATATSDIDNSFGARPDYAVINPGQANTIKVRSDLPAIDPDTGLPTGALSPLAGQTFNLSKEDLGFPDVKRDYYSLELSFERAFDGKWTLSGSYTLSKLIGNYEGTVKSDAGNGAQVDAGSTEAFDYPGLTDYDYGLLPNHRAHEIKLYGAYQIIPNLLIGANLQVTSPRQYGCLGVYPSPGSTYAAGGFGGVDPVASGYGGVSRYCYNSTLGYSVPTERGEGFSGDWFYQLDLSARFTVPKFSKYVPGNLVLRVDAFNVINSQQVVQYDEVGDSSAGQPSGTYKLPLIYQTPRYIRFGFDYTF